MMSGTGKDSGPSDGASRSVGVDGMGDGACRRKISAYSGDQVDHSADSEVQSTLHNHIPKAGGAKKVHYRTFAVSCIQITQRLSTLSTSILHCLLVHMTIPIFFQG
jgi:hypothetical protein